MSDEPELRITILDNGPYLVEGGLPVYGATGELLSDRESYALCRCGGSANKPFCDGTHRKNGFDGTEGAELVSTSRTTLGGTGLTVTDDRAICAHAGYCGNELTNVWDAVPETGERKAAQDMVIGMIDRCPSGALSYVLDDGTPPPAGVSRVIATTNGPYWLYGPVPLASAAREAEYEPHRRRALCRCGASSSKPYCDGSHRERGFVA